MEKSATLFRPKLIVAGASAYARLYDYARIRKVSQSHIQIHEKERQLTTEYGNQEFWFKLFSRSVTSKKL